MNAQVKRGGLDFDFGALKYCLGAPGVRGSRGMGGALGIGLGFLRLAGLDIAAEGGGWIDFSCGGGPDNAGVGGGLCFAGLGRVGARIGSMTGGACGRDGGACGGGDGLWLVGLGGL